MWKLLSSQVYLLFIIFLSLLYIGASQVSDFVSCAGFVEAASELELAKKPDYSFIKVHLVSKISGVTKETSECAPNGFFLIPIYDSGDFELVVEGPEGWNFEPTKVPVSIEDGKCNRGVNTKFIFTGFSIFGEVTSPTCEGTTINQVQLQLFEDGKQLAQTSSSSTGKYVFSNIKPGNYIIKAKPDSSLNFEKDSVSAKVEWGNAQTSDVIEISGYKVIGTVQSDITATVDFHLFKQGAKESFRSTQSDKSGKFTFQMIPCGSYTLVPTCKAEGTTYDVSPSSVDLEVKASSISLPEFRVVGFSVRGKVVDRENQGLSGVSVIVDGQKTTETKLDGSFVWEKATAGTYSINFVKEHYYFPSFSSININPRSSSLDTVQVEQFDLCGKLELDESTGFSKRRTISLKGNSLSLTTKTENGNFCFQVKPGEYTIEPVISQKEKELSLYFEPASISVRVENEPVLDQDFSQIKVQISGVLNCIDTKCNSQIILASTVSSKERTTNAENGRFLFNDVYPGDYILSVNQPFWCWESTTQKIQVKRNNLENLQFTQTGYKVEFHSQTQMNLVAAHQGSSDQLSFPVNSGENSICLRTSGSYRLEAKSCLKYLRDSFTISTEETNRERIEFIPTHILIEGTIRLRSPVELNSTLVEVISASETQEITASPSDLQSILNFNHWATPGESLQIHPKVVNDILFYPPQQEVQVPRTMKCMDPITPFEARQGKFISGTIQPVLENVEIIIRNKKSLDIVQKVYSNSKGEYSAGPLYDNIEYTASAHLEGYHFPSADVNSNFVAVELRHFTVTIKDENQLPIAGVILTLTGTDSFYNSSLTDENGRCYFEELFPGNYYLRPALKEYVFEPSSKSIEITEGGSQQETFIGKRVAYSCYGSVRSLNGEPEKSVVIFAKSSSGEYEETQTDNQGNFRIRGLKPTLEYFISVKQAGKIDSASPAVVQKLVDYADISGISFIAFRSFHKFDIYGTVLASQEHLHTLSVELYVNNKKQQKEELLRTYQLGPMNYFDFPQLPNEEFIIKLKTTLNPVQYDFELAEITINIDELVKQNALNHNRYFVPLSFNAKLHVVPNDIADVSFYPLPILVIVCLGYWYRKNIMQKWNAKPQESKGWTNVVTKSKSKS